MKRIPQRLSHSSLFGYNKEKYSEEDILSGIVNNNDNMIRYIYKSFFPGIKSMVGSFHNLSLDTEDIFQEGLTRAVINVRELKFHGKSTFYTYLTSICRNICLKELKRPVNLQEVDKGSEVINGSEEHVEDLIERMTEVKNKMDESCKQIIDLRFGLGKSSNQQFDSYQPVESVKFEDIAKQLQIETDNARQRFRRCFEKFKMVLFKDREWKGLTN